MYLFPIFQIKKSKACLLLFLCPDQTNTYYWHQWRKQAGAECPPPDFWPGNFCWPTGKREARKKGKWSRKEGKLTSGSGTTSLAWTYIKVCGYSDSFCKNLNQRSLTPRWPLTPHLLKSYVWLYPRIIVSKSHENPSKYVDTVTFFAKTWSKGHWPLGDLWPHICWGHMCDSTQGSLWPSPMKIHQSMWIQWPFLQKKREPKVIDPHMTFDPTSVEVTCVTLPKDHCVQVPWKYIKVCGYSEPFC